MNSNLIFREKLKKRSFLKSSFEAIEGKNACKNISNSIIHHMGGKSK
mgnify:CR=1 FL=1